MSDGILYVVFGDDYAKLSSASIRYGRKYTKVPIHIITNVKSNYWSGIPLITVGYYNKQQTENRKAKLNIHRATPFDRTLYIDCDTVIQSGGVETAFELLNNYDIIFNHLDIYIKKAPNIYKECMNMFGVKPPLTIYNGGIFAFKKTASVNLFFESWYKLWIKFGHGREMPPLNCAIKLSKINNGIFKKGFFAPDSENNNAVIQHNWDMGRFCKKFKLPLWKEYKPFDGNPNDFHWANI